MSCFLDPFCYFTFQIGLAVDDIKGVQEQAVLERQAMLVRSELIAFDKSQ